MLAAAETADVQEDEIFGKDKRGDEMPDWASDKAKRLAKIQEATAALEADAKLAAEEERRIEAEKQRQASSFDRAASDRTVPLLSAARDRAGCCFEVSSRQTSGQSPSRGRKCVKQIVDCSGNSVSG
jgi:hypothetical protein